MADCKTVGLGGITDRAMLTKVLSKWECDGNTEFCDPCKSDPDNVGPRTPLSAPRVDDKTGSECLCDPRKEREALLI